MYSVNIKDYEVKESSNKGINKEWSLGEYYGIHRRKHDHTPYNEGSDFEVSGMKISVKSPKATLMSGRYCTDCEDFEAILKKYLETTHSDTVVFITDDFEAYYMNMKEFSKFIQCFGYLKKDSERNGGYTKIAILAESKKMKRWLDKATA